MNRESERPYIFVGGGAILSGASKELYEFVKKVDAPVTDSLMGKGAFPGTDPLYTGMLGMHGTKTSNYGVSECDLLIVTGARFSDRVTGNTATFAKDIPAIAEMSNQNRLRMFLFYHNFFSEFLLYATLAKHQSTN